MHKWDFPKKKTKRIPVIRIGDMGHVQKYKSLCQAAKLNKTYLKKIKKHIESQKKLNGYLFDYQ